MLYAPVPGAALGQECAVCMTQAERGAQILNAASTFLFTVPFLAYVAKTHQRPGVRKTAGTAAITIGLVNAFLVLRYLGARST